MYAATTFFDYPYGNGYLVYDYDTSTMKRFDYLGLRDSSIDPPAQINGIPLQTNPGTSLVSGSYAISNAGGGRLFSYGDSSLWMYDIPNNKGYWFTETGLYDGTTTINYGAGSIARTNFQSIGMLAEGNYLYSREGTTILWKYDIANNKFVEKITNTYIQTIDATLNLTGESMTPFGITQFWYDDTNHFLFRAYYNSILKKSNYHTIDLNTGIASEINSASITNGNIIDSSTTTFSKASGDPINRRIVFGGSSSIINTGEKNAIYEITY